MFEKLFLLVKNNAGQAVINNPLIPQKYHEAIIIEASSTIIEVLKGQMETGKMTDLVKAFRFTGVYNHSLIAIVSKKFVNKLNKFYNIDTNSAILIANSLIPPVMHELIAQSKNQHNKDFSLHNLLSKLNGNRVDLSGQMNRLMMA